MGCERQDPQRCHSFCAFANFCVFAVSMGRLVAGLVTIPWSSAREEFCLMPHHSSLDSHALNRRRWSRVVLAVPVELSSSAFHHSVTIPNVGGKFLLEGLGIFYYTTQQGRAQRGGEHV